MPASEPFWFPLLPPNPRAPRIRIPGRALVVYQVHKAPSEGGADILRIVHLTEHVFARFAAVADAAEKERRRLERRAKTREARLRGVGGDVGAEVSK